MNGGTAISGFVYQKSFLAFRVLASVSHRLITACASPCICRLAIEGRTSEDGPVWDVRFELDDGTVELLECKNTSIKRADRETFYRRVCQEIASGTALDRLIVGWVTDPDKQDTDILSHFRGMIELANSPLGGSTDTWPNPVASPQDALQEAVYCLTHNEENALTVEDGLSLMVRLKVFEHKASELRESVTLLCDGLSTTGTRDAIHRFLIGTFFDEIAMGGSVDYTVTEFLDLAGIGPIALSASGMLRDLLMAHSAAGVQSVIASVRWEQLPDQPEKVWPVSERLQDMDDNASCMITAQTGVGKTTTSWQLFEMHKADHDHHSVLRFDAATLDDTLLGNLPGLLCVLAGVARTWLVIDVLDEISSDRIQPWRAVLARLLGLPNVTVVVTVRDEVLSAYEWMQQLIGPFRQIPLPKLSTEQVEGAFREVGLQVPQSPSLIECLRNTFSLSIYAQVVTPADLPLATSGEVTGFHVIECYWQRRVLTDSPGLRGEDTDLTACYLKRKAVAFIQAKLIEGETTFSRQDANPETSRGIDILLREGVLRRHSTNVVSWWHEWLREYALIDGIIASIDTPSPDRLANACAQCSEDHVRRTASIAAIKYVLIHRRWGPVEEFLIACHTQLEHLASAGLPVLVEGDASRFSLNALPAALIVEFIEVAIQLSAFHG